MTARKYPDQEGQQPLWGGGGGTTPPPMAPPGYNVGPEQASTQAPARFRLRNAVQGAAERFVGAGGVQALTDRFAAPAPSPLQKAVGAAFPGGMAAWETAKWAFRGNRTAHTYSLAREQNMYGGVQRSVIPTKDISVQPMKYSPGATQRAASRERLNTEELYPPAAAYDQPYQIPSYHSGSMPPLDRMGRGVPQAVPVMSEDPLFSMNTGQGVPNPYGFNPHQRATSGIPQPGR